jgi:branched-chain amino acid aminotransferase
VSERRIHLNGRLEPERGPHISALDRGFTLGDGVFDTIRVVQGRPFRLAEHLDRLAASAATVGLPLPAGPQELAAAVAELLEANGLSDAIVRITVSRGVPTERGVLPPESPISSLAIVATPFGGYPEERYERGYRAVVSRVRRNPTSPLSRIKSCNYLDSVLAGMEAARQGADEALLLATSGELACGSSSNLFLVLGGTLVTPSLESGVLDGVTRRAVMELARQLGVPCQQRDVLPEEMPTAREVFVTNTALGVMPVVSVDGRAVGPGVPGPLTRRLRRAYEEALLRSART